MSMDIIFGQAALAEAAYANFLDETGQLKTQSEIRLELG
jgi:hypothetical protein